MAVAFPVLTEQQRKWGRRIGYPLFGLFVFVYALHLTFPYGRIEERLQAFAGDGFDVSLASAGPGLFPGDVELEGLTFKSRPSRADEKPIEFTIDELSLDIGVFAAIGGSVVIDLEAVIGAGTLEGEVSSSKQGTTIALSSNELPLGAMPGIRSATGGAPMEGGAALSIDLSLPGNKWKEATGKIRLDCDGCTIGDGQSKIRANQPGGATNAFSEGGFTLPKLKLGKVGGTLDIVKGIGKFKEFAGKSPDGEINIEGEIRFEDPPGRSQVTAYMKFKVADSLVSREPKMGDVVSMMKGQAQRPDGFMGVRVTGMLNALRFISSKTSPVPGASDGPGSSRASRAAAGMNSALGESGRVAPPIELPPPGPPDSASPPPGSDQIQPSIPPPTPPTEQPPPSPPMQEPIGSGMQPVEGNLREVQPPPQAPVVEDARAAEPPPPPPPQEFNPDAQVQEPPQPQQQY